MAPRRLDQNLHGALQVIRVADLHGEGQAHARVGIGFVLHHRTDQHIVRHDGLHAVGPAQDGIARGDLRHLAAELVHRDDVAEPDRAVEQEDEAGDVVAGDLLQAEAEADAQRAAEYRQGGEVDADLRQEVVGRAVGDGGALEGVRGEARGVGVAAPGQAAALVEEVRLVDAEVGLQVLEVVGVADVGVVDLGQEA